jgi:hypothetical protein
VIHPTIQIFQQRAELLDVQRSSGGLDDAIAKLPAWMDLARARLRTSALNRTLCLLRVARLITPSIASTSFIADTQDDFTVCLRLGVQIPAAAQAMEDDVLDCLVSGYEHVIEGPEATGP